MVGLLSGMGNVRRASVRRGIVCRGYVLGEVSVGLLSGRATVRESYFTTNSSTPLNESMLLNRVAFPLL